MTKRNQCEPWTPDEMIILRDNYPRTGTVGVSKLISRSRGAIKRVASLNGIKTSHEYRSAAAAAVNKTWKRTEEMKKRIGDGHRKHKPFVCIECGAKIAYYAKRRASCRDRSREKNPNWRGGVASLTHIVETALRPLWRIPIFIRDNQTCQECGATRNLQVHHRRKYTLIRDEIIKNNPQFSVNSISGKFALAKMIISDHKLEDGVTLCKQCHKLIHRKKSGELRESLNTAGVHGNPQPSCSNVLNFVGQTAQRLTPEDAQSDNGDTSARNLVAEVMR